jgi:hypothetical protein
MFWEWWLSINGPRTAIAIAGVLLLATPLLLPRRDHAQQREPDLAPRPTE